MKQSRGSIPAQETGAPRGTYKGTRNNDKMPEKGGRNATTNESMRGAGGMAPKPSGGANLLGNDRPSNPTTASMARVTDSSRGDSAMRMPLQSPKANVSSKRIGQAEVDPGGPGIGIPPQTRTPKTRNPVATEKPTRHRANKLNPFYNDYGG